MKIIKKKHDGSDSEEDKESLLSYKLEDKTPLRKN
jgi:hypothetical protein